MLITTDGIVLRQRKIAGNRRMIVLFTRQYGKISAGTSLNEKGRSRSALALRPFAFAEYELFRGRESYSINSAAVKNSFYSIGEEYERFDRASVCLNYLDRVLQEGEPAPGLFDLALGFLNSAAEAGSSCMDTLLYAFVVKSLGMLGVSPELKMCVNCGKSPDTFGKELQNGKRARLFSVSSGGIICEECAKQEKTERSALIYGPDFDIIDVFSFFTARPLRTFEKVSLRKEVSGTIQAILAEYLRLYLGTDILESKTETEAEYGYQSGKNRDS